MRLALAVLAAAFLVGGAAVADTRRIASSTFTGTENPLSEKRLWKTPFLSMSPQGTVMMKNGGDALANQAIGPGQNHAGAWTTAAVPNDHYSEIVVGHVTTGGYKVGPVVRYQRAGGTRDSHYVWWVSPSGDINNNLYRMDANGIAYRAESILSVSGASDEDVLRLYARGPLIYGVKNGIREFIYNTGQDATVYSTGTTGIVAFPPAGGATTNATIASWSTGSVFSSSGTSDSSTFAGSEKPLDERDRWYPVCGAQLGAGFAKRGGIARGIVAGIHNLEGAWKITLPNDQYSQVTLADVTSGGGGPMVRVSRTATGQSGYLLFVSIDTPSSSGIYRNEATINSLTLLAGFTPSSAPAIGDVWKLSAIGNTLTAYRNGVQVVQATDSTYASGDAGIEGFGNVFGFSAWQAGSTAVTDDAVRRSTPLRLRPRGSIQ